MISIAQYFLSNTTPEDINDVTGGNDPPQRTKMSAK